MRWPPRRSPPFPAAVGPLDKRSASEPTGLLRSHRSAPAIGRIMPSTHRLRRFPYADGRMGYHPSDSDLEQIAQGGRCRFAARLGALSINGALARAGAHVMILGGGVLPQWRDCRALGKDEFFVFSDRSRTALIVATRPG